MNIHISNVLLNGNALREPDGEKQEIYLTKSCKSERKEIYVAVEFLLLKFSFWRDSLSLLLCRMFVYCFSKGFRLSFQLLCLSFNLFGIEHLW